jgi:hypothetical protein
MNRAVRDALSECAAFIRDRWDIDTADAIELWRDRNFPEAPPPFYHRWFQVNKLIEGRWTDRRCDRCGLVQDFGPLVEGGRHVARYVSVNGQVTQKKHHPVPSCSPSLSRSRKE